MRIQHNIMAMNSYRNLGVNNNAISKNLEKLSSGYAINRAGDDAAGLAVSEKMRMQITGLDVAQDNAQAGINLVQTAEGALTEVHDMLNRMYELAAKAANDTYDASDKNKYKAEVDQLAAEITRIAEKTTYNDIKLLDGSHATADSAITLQIGDAAGTVLAFTIGTATAAALTVEAADVILSSSGAASAAMGTIKTAINAVSEIRSNLGAIQNRLEHTINNLAVTEENIQQSESTIRDTDVAEEMMAYTKNNILIQSAQAMLAQANQVPQGVLQLLQ